MNKSIFNWSGGKDSAMALYQVKQEPQYQISKLLTSVNTTHNRVSMHGVRVSLLEEQARQLGFPLQKLELQELPSMEDYDSLMRKTMEGLKAEGFTHSIFGDIFLEDLRHYREKRLAEAGFSAHFPIWKKDTTRLIEEFLDLGFKTILVCINADLLDASFAGRVIDKDFLKDLPRNVDPCGENGEFHTFVFDGPIFKEPVKFTVGETVLREYKAPADCDTSEDLRKPAPKSMRFLFTDLVEIDEKHS
jgi:uncharacterized protein (TIGR00290 family)